MKFRNKENQKSFLLEKATANCLPYCYWQLAILLYPNICVQELRIVSGLYPSLHFLYKYMLNGT